VYFGDEMFITCVDQHPARPRHRCWRDGEQRGVIGKCLQSAFAPEDNSEVSALITAVVAKLSANGSRD